MVDANIDNMNVGRATVQELGVIRMNAGTGSTNDESNILLQDIKASLVGDGVSDRNVADVITYQVQLLLQELRRVTANTANMNRGTTVGGAVNGNINGGVEITNILNNIQNSLLAFNEKLRESVDQENDNLYEKRVKLKEYAFLDASINKKIDSFFGVGLNNMSNAFQGYSNVFRQQQASVVKNFVREVSDFTLNLGNLGESFSKLRHTIVSESQGYMRDVFGSSALLPQEYFFDGLTRLTRGMLLSSDSLISTFHTVDDALKANMMSPLADTGKTLSQYAMDLHNMRADLDKTYGGFQLKGFLTTTQENKIAQDILDTLHKQGISAQINDNITEQYLIQQGNIFRQIASNTGMTVEKIAAMAKEFSDQNASLVALGRLTSAQANRFSALEGGLKGTLGGGADPIIRVMHEMVNMGNNQMNFLATNPEWRNPYLQPLLQGIQSINATMMRGLRPGETEAQRQAEIQNEARIAVQESAPLREINPAVYNNVFGGLGSQIGSMIAGLTQLATKGLPTAAQAGNAQASPFNVMVRDIQDIWTNVAGPLFSGLGGVLGANTIALAANTIALIRVGGGIGGLLSSGGDIEAAAGLGTSFLGKAARVAAPAVAGVAAYASGANTGGIAGATLGSVAGEVMAPIIGRVIGGTLGTFLGGPIGTAIGATAGGYIFEKLGSWLEGEFTGPEKTNTGTPSAASMVGPSTAVNNITADVSQQSIGFQSDSVELLSRISQSLQSNNDILSQLYGETAKQTTLITGGSSGSPMPYLSSQGLASNITSKASGRPSSGGPTDGAGSY